MAKILVGSTHYKLESTDHCMYSMNEFVKVVRLTSSTPMAKKPNAGLEEPSFGPEPLSETFEILARPAQKLPKPKMLDLICQAIEVIGVRNKGASYLGIRKWIVDNSGIEMKNGQLTASLKRAITAGLEKEILRRPKEFQDSLGLKGWFVIVKNLTKKEQSKVAQISDTTVKTRKVDQGKSKDGAKSAPKAVKPKDGAQSAPKAVKPKDGAQSAPKAVKPKDGAKSAPKAIKPKDGAKSAPKAVKPKDGDKNALKVLKSKDGSKSVPITGKSQDAAEISPKVKPKVGAKKVSKIAKPRTETEGGPKSKRVKKVVTDNMAEHLNEVEEAENDHIVEKAKIVPKMAPLNTETKNGVTESLSEDDASEVAPTVTKSKTKTVIKKTKNDVAVPETGSSIKVKAIKNIKVAKSKVEVKTASEKTKTQNVETVSETRQPLNKDETKSVPTVAKSKVKAKTGPKNIHTRNIVTFLETKELLNEDAIEDDVPTAVNSKVEVKAAPKKKNENVLTASETEISSSSIPKHDFSKQRKANSAIKKVNYKLFPKETINKRLPTGFAKPTLKTMPRKDLSDTELEVKPRKSLKSYSSDTDINNIDSNKVTLEQVKQKPKNKKPTKNVL